MGKNTCSWLVSPTGAYVSAPLVPWRAGASFPWPGLSSRRFNDSRLDHSVSWQATCWWLLSRKLILCLYGFKRAFRSCSGCCWSCALRDSSAALYLLGQWSSAGSCEEDIWRAGRRSEAFNARFLNATPQGGLEMAQRWLTRHCNDRRSVGLSQRAKAFHFPARRSWQEKPGNCCNSSFIWFAIGFHLLWAAFDSFSFSSSSHELVVWVIARVLIVRLALIFP